ncbi:phosphoesterase [Alkalihalobacillus alcalophilus ATCC 27647 = CGMCC 1.3604]|nr:metallophosphoesterase [Alkalihalobacillus alcalophilus]KGA97660.1 phosphoesterase [Alkalihalobacillus alcalophilus ATCC 27647 = CGMCC 1.3604]
MAIIGVPLFLSDQNNRLVVTEFELEGLDQSHFGELKIVHLSDLHSKSFGSKQRKLLNRVEELQPDLIVVTGDLIDAKKAESEAPLHLMEGLVELAPVYFVTGNHEWWSGDFGQLEMNLEQIGVEVMRNDYKTVHLKKGQLNIVGIDDPAIQSNQSEEITTEQHLSVIFENELIEAENYTILLAHRPEFFALYQEYDVDLILSGHAHGGQIGLPNNGGLIAPNQGLFPEYVKGMYTGKSSKMIVHRGLGNSIIPQRLFNRPEIILLRN